MSSRRLLGVLALAFLVALGCAAESGAGGGGAAGVGGAAGTAGTAGAGAIGGTAGIGGSGGIGGGAAIGGVGGAGFGGVGGVAGMPDAGSGGNEGCESIESESPVERGAVDIIWIIDASCSMFDELMKVQMNLNAFATDIAAAGVDHRVVMITGFADPAAGTPLGADMSRYRYINANVDSWNAMPMLISTFPQYSSFLRPNAPTHVVVVTDDESNTPAATFKPMFEQQLGHPFFYHSIASESVNGGPCPCGVPFVCVGGMAGQNVATAPGLEHYALSDMTSGLKVSICVPDWSAVFGPLKDAVITSVPLPCSFVIPPPPTGVELDKDRVNFEYTGSSGTAMAWPRANQPQDCGTQIGWYYDDPAAPSTIELCPSGCDAVSGGGKISIVFGCEMPPIIVPE